MGKGYSYICKKCKHKYGVSTGAGMMYPILYRELIDAISEGKYGAELQESYENTPYAAVDAENIVYICRECGAWEEDTDVSIYAPNDPDSFSKKEYGEKTVAEWGYVPYVMQQELEEEFHVVKKYYHYCSKCGKRMHKASADELKNLPCPECGTVNHANDGFMWD